MWHCKVPHPVEHHQLGSAQAQELNGVRHIEGCTPTAAKRKRRIPFSNFEARKRIVAFETIRKIQYPGGPRQSPEAATAQHQSTEPSVQPPNALLLLNIQPPPHVKHGAASQSTNAISENLTQLSSTRYTESRQSESRSKKKQQQQLQALSSSHRHATADVHSDKQCLQWLVLCMLTSIGPEGFG